MKSIYKYSSVLLIIALAACSKPADQNTDVKVVDSGDTKAAVTETTTTELNIYSARQEHLLKPLLDKFEASNGVKVNLVSGRADALLQRLESEGQNSEADIFVTTDAGRLHRAKTAGVLQSVESQSLTSKLPAQMRDPDGYWYGISQRARPIMYVKGRVDPTAISTYEQLADEQWKGKICIRSSGNIYNQSLVASMIESNGEEATEAWARGLVANLAREPKGGDRDQIKAAVAGECDLVVANTYYLGGMLTGDVEEDRVTAGQIGIIWPNQNDRGAHVNVTGVGVTAASKNKDIAIQFIEFMLSEEAQSHYALENAEYPVIASVEQSDTLKSWGEFKADSLTLSRLGELNADATRLMDRAGWK